MTHYALRITHYALRITTHATQKGIHTMTLETREPAAGAVSPADLKERARWLRRRIIEMTTAAGSGHPSSSFSATEIIVALYFGGILRHDPARPDWPDRDRFILSKGHGVPALYAALAEAGYFPVEELMTLRQLGSRLEGHPNMRRLPGLEASTGSLGQGLSIGCGVALAAKLDAKEYRTFVMLGDGECDEGQVWEAAMTAAHHQLHQLVAIVDHNGYQQTGAVDRVMNIEPLAAKWEAFGWKAREIDGHDFNHVLDALRWAHAGGGAPHVIIARTKKGKGVSFVEADYSFHGKALTADEAKRALEELGWA
jgi:transketolase